MFKVLILIYTVYWHESKLARHYSISFQAVENKSRRFKVRNSTFECFATDRFQAILFRARLAMKQRKENSNDTTRPNWHFRFFTLRVFLESGFRCALRVYCNSTSSLSDVKRKMKSVTFVLSHESDGHARAIFLFFFLSFLLRHRGRHWRIPVDARTSLSFNFIILNTLQRDSKTARCFYVIFK